MTSGLRNGVVSLLLSFMTALLEICAFTPHAAIMALNAGAQRVELCAEPNLDGISPPESWYHLIPENLHTKLAVMVRPRGGSFCMNEQEILQMELEIRQLREKQRAAAVVFGILTPDLQIDMAACIRLLAAAGPMETVFHRAFDSIPNPHDALEQLIALGFTRMLCGLPLPMLLELKRQAAGKITIMPGGGIRSVNVQDYLQAGFTEIHSSARLTASLDPDEAELQRLINLCA